MFFGLQFVNPSLPSTAKISIGFFACDLFTFNSAVIRSCRPNMIGQVNSLFADWKYPAAANLLLEIRKALQTVNLFCNLWTIHQVRVLTDWFGSLTQSSINYILRLGKIRN